MEQFGTRSNHSNFYDQSICVYMLQWGTLELEVETSFNRHFFQSASYPEKKNRLKTNRKSCIDFWNYNKHESAEQSGFHSNVQINWKLDAKIIRVSEKFSPQSGPIFRNFANVDAFKRRNLSIHLKKSQNFN